MTFRKDVKPFVPKESHEGTDLAEWLDSIGAVYTHVPLGGLRPGRAGERLRAEGTKRGCPDYLIFSGPTRPVKGLPSGGFRGVAVELKRRKGGTLKPHQKRFHEKLRACGWVVLVARGVDDAKRQLRALGYGLDAAA